MHHCISISAAAELCGVGEPAIRRAFREGRIKPAFFWHNGRNNVGTYLNLYSAVSAYGVDEAEVKSLLAKWTKQATIARTPDGREWLILDVIPSMMFMEGSSSADWVID